MEKCYCDNYRNAVEGSVDEIGVGPNESVTSDEFIKDADRICPGTRIALGHNALNAENVIIEEDFVKLPRDAVTLECRYREYRLRGSL